MRKETSIPFQVEEYSEWFSRAVDLVFIAQRRAVARLQDLLPRARRISRTYFPNACLNETGKRQRFEPYRAASWDPTCWKTSTTGSAWTGPPAALSIWDKELNRMVANDIEIAASEERGGDDLSIIPPTGRTIVNVINSVELDENGPVQTVMRITGDVAGVPIVQRLTLYQGLKRIDIEDRVDWKPGRSMNIEQVFPLPQPNMEVRNGTPFGIGGRHRYDAECRTAQ